MYRAPAQIVGLLVGGVHCFSTCWRIERRDGVTLYFTNHDKPLVVDGDTYLPHAAPSASAKSKTEGLGRVMDTELRGFIDSPIISDDDLRAGKYRGAKVTEFVVDWRFPWAGRFRTLIYWVRETTFDRESWVGQCEGLLGRMKNKVGNVMTRTCRHVLGDAKCKVALGPITVSGTVASVVRATSRFTATGVTSRPDGYYDYGRLVWTGGTNNGTGGIVKSYLNAGNEITLQLSTPYDIDVGDTFTVYPGCDGELSTCIEKFGNVDNFGGYPKLVGVDKQFSTTGAPI